MKQRIKEVKRSLKHWIQYTMCKIRHGACLECVEWYNNWESQQLKESNKSLKELKRQLRKEKNAVWN